MHGGNSVKLLEGKTALVTGSNRGIGRSIAEQFVAHGATVYANARKVGSLDALIEHCENEYGGTIHPLYFDVTNASDAKKAFIEIRKTAGHLDVLVNNAGIMKDALIGMISHDAMQEVFDVNVFAAMEMLQLAVKLMKRQNTGSIINVSSIVGVQGNPGQLVYSASKGAVISMTKTAAKELAPFNIRVNAVAPGIIDTDMFRSISIKHQQERIDKISMGRIGTTQDIANTCLYLASDLSTYVTGQIIGIDGAAIM